MLHTPHPARRRLTRLVVAGALTLVTLTCATPTAGAQGRSQSLDPKGRARGLTAVAALGLDGCTGQQCSQTLPLLYTRVHLMFRALPYLSAGVHMAFNFLAPAYRTGASRAELWELLVGPEVRGIFPIKRFDIWVGFALGYYRSYRLLVDEGHEVESATDAFGIGWGLGLDYYLLTSKAGALAIGGDVWFYKPFPIELCTTMGDNDTQCVDSGLAGLFGVTYAAGVTLTWFLSI